MEKKYDVIALGELLIDFPMNGRANRETICLRRAREEHPAMSWHF